MGSKGAAAVVKSTNIVRSCLAISPRHKALSLLVSSHLTENANGIQYNKSTVPEPKQRTRAGVDNRQPVERVADHLSH